MHGLSFVLLAVAVALAGCTRPEPSPEPIRSVRTFTIEAQTVAPTVEYTGEVRPRTESRLAFRVGGKIVRRHAELGATVRAGQPLAQLDARDLRLVEDGAIAALAAARANHEQALADHQRFSELLAKGFISSAELERRTTVLKAARAQLEQAGAQAAAQGHQAAYATLHADASGVITGVEAEPGMVVAAGTPVVRLAHDGPRDVVFAVPEDRIGLVKRLATQDGAFRVRLWGSDAAPIAARVREIAAAADPATRTFAVKVDIGKASEVRLGQTATVLVALPPAEGVTKLPLSALREQSGESAVWLVDRETMSVRSRNVQVLGADGNLAVIGAGVGPGDVVVTAGVHVLSAGQKVRLYVEPVPTGASTSAAPVSAALVLK